MDYLLDTNTCIYIIKKKPVEVFERFRGLKPGSMAISTITLAELHFGVMKSSNPAKNLEALEKFLIPLDIIDFDYNATKVYGEIRAYLEQKGTPIGSLDTLIAAHAQSHGLTLITNNVREFSRVPGLCVENWVV